MMINPTGRITRGQFSFLPDLGDDEITLQIGYGLRRGDAWSMEDSGDPHPRNSCRELFGMPMFDLQDAAGVMVELRHCRQTFAMHHIRLMAFVRTRKVETIAMRFIVDCPASEPGFGLVQQESAGRTRRCTVHGCGTDEPQAERD